MAGRGDHILSGWSNFWVIWSGQFVSMFGSGLTTFSLAFWAFHETDRASYIALITFSKFATTAIASPFAGILADRFDRKILILLGNLGLMLLSAIMCALSIVNHLSYEVVIGILALSGLCDAVQLISFDSIVSLIAPSRKHFSKVNAMISLANKAPQVVAPLVASLLLGSVGLSLILMVDSGTFLFCIITLLLASVPQKLESRHKLQLLNELKFPLNYIYSNAGLRRIQIISISINFLVGFAGSGSILPALVLVYTHNNAGILARVVSIGGCGAIIGGIVIGAWGGPRKKVHGILIGVLVSSLCGRFLVGVGHTQFTWILGVFVIQMMIPLINSSDQAIWQAKVPQEIQGKVFSARIIAGDISYPLGILVSGFLADHFFTPSMAQQGTYLVSIFGWIVGHGPGAGLSLMYVISAILGGGVAIWGYLSGAVRGIEQSEPTVSRGVQALK
ncbi:MFS transporter [Alicyclobacillus sp. SO9]|uniref:MFS transporter n=1 Tax=Alicyclobacillus sp. SO9 TaxID=2665646 RepID=UPI0018E8FF1C|nr:MFS transporter [Alicyclobacillus sp. SO9]QQE79736.1 MFS transporter [Alicyclobacillus sp. SO9]